MIHIPEISGFVSTNPLLQGTSLTLHPESGPLPGKPFIEGSAGLVTMSLGRISAENWLHLRLPWWNPYSGVGLPLASNLQPAAFFLPFVLLLHFYNGVMLMKISMQILTGLAMFAFLRQLAIGQWAATIAAILFQCNGSFAFYSDTPILPIAFLPLLLLGIEQVRTAVLHGRFGGCATIAAAIAYSIVAGFPETAFLDGLLGLAWATVRSRSLGWSGALRFSGRVSLAGLAGLALASPALIPFFHDLTISTLGTFDRVSGVGSSVLSVSAIPLLLFPYFNGPPLAQWSPMTWAFLGGFFGTVVLTLSLFAWPNRERRGPTILFFVWLIVGLATVTGVPVVSNIIHAIPILNQIMISRYGFPSFSFCTCALAAFTLDRYAIQTMRRRTGPPFTILATAMCISLVAGFVCVVTGRGTISGVRWVSGLSIAWGIGASLVLAILLGAPANNRRRSMVTAIILFDAIGLFMPPILTGLRDPRMFDKPIAFLKHNTGLQRVVSAGDVLWPNAGAYYQLGTINYDYLPVPKVWANYVSNALSPYSHHVMFPDFMEPPSASAAIIASHVATLQRLAVRYVTAPSALNVFAPASGTQSPTRVFREGGIDIFELPMAKPYAEMQGGNCRLSVEDREHMTVDCDAPAHLLRRELSFPGWHASVNGRHARISTSDDIFQRIDLPVGQSTIIWRYIPEYANTIALLFGLGIIGLIAPMSIRHLRHVVVHRRQMVVSTA